MEVRAIVSGASALALLSLAALAGPLDRQSGDYEYRTNPNVYDMLRVPGIIGTAYQDAMQILQQAGLNPHMKRIARFDERYDGQEGLVVAQMPLPGGVAMIGSSVTVIYYMPAAQQPSGTPPAGETGSDDSSHPATPATSGASGSAPPVGGVNKDKRGEPLPSPRFEPGLDQPDSSDGDEGNLRQGGR